MVQSRWRRHTLQDLVDGFHRRAEISLGLHGMVMGVVQVGKAYFPNPVKKGKDQKIVQRLEYNAKHQLIKFEERINGTLKQALTFRYDPFGRRIEKSVFKRDKPEQQTEWATNYKRYTAGNQPDLWYHYGERYVWNGGSLIQTRHIDCNLNNRTFQQYYLYEPYSHKPVGMYDYELGLLDIESDHLGTAKALYNHDTGEQLWATEHEVYGRTKNSQSHKNHPRNGFAVDPKLRFAGQYEDIETGLYQNFNRYYDPQTGRYISHDPIGLAGGLNVYQYCPNPLEWVDPLGLVKVYRNLRPDEDPSQGLSAKEPNRNMSVDGHVRTGTRHNGSQYISTTLDPEVASKWNQPGQTTVMFDTDDVVPDVLGNRGIMDISTKEKAITHGIKGVPLRFVDSSKEVLIVGHVPSSALHIIDLKIRVKKQSDCPK